jgi:phosphoribosylanthranilate isomerase
MIVQIYEVSNPREAEELENLGVDHIGVLVGKGEYPRELNFNEAKKIFKVLSEKTKKVALSLSKKMEDFAEIIQETHPDILHLGALPKDVTPLDVKKLKQRFPYIKIMRTIPVTDENSIDLAKKYDGIADYLLLDTLKKEQVGVTGQIHNWQISKKIVGSVKTPVILAGGLGPDNVDEAIKTVKPAGVDSKTKTDKTNGQGKDLEKVKEFVLKAKSIIKM